jgi:hypothetical protein
MKFSSKSVLLGLFLLGMLLQMLALFVNSLLLPLSSLFVLIVLVVYLIYSCNHRLESSVHGD